MKSLFYPQIWITKLIEWCIALLIIVMPIHNVILQFVTNVLGGGAIVAVWKDVVLVVLVTACLYQILAILLQLHIGDNKNGAQHESIAKGWLISNESKQTIGEHILRSYITSIITICTGAVLIIGFGASAWINNTQLNAIIFGFYFEIWWVLIILVLIIWAHLHYVFVNIRIPVIDTTPQQHNSRIKITSIQESGLHTSIQSTKSPFQLHSQFFQKRLLVRIPLYVAIGLIIPFVVSLLIIGLGQVPVLEKLGYQQFALSDGGLVSNSELCHPIDMGIDVCRLSSTFSHPLHLVTYLVMIVPFVCIFMLRFAGTKGEKYIWFALIIVSILAVLTFSRFVVFGWILLLFCWLVFWFVNLSSYDINSRLKAYFAGIYSVTIAILIASIIGAGLLFVFISGNTQESASPIVSALPEAIRKPNSTLLHYRHMRVRGLLVEDNKVNGVGYGPGTVGSAARTKYQDFENNPIYQDINNPYNQNYIPIGTQMLTENWIVQIWVNYGFLFSLVYVSILIWMMRDLRNIFSFKLNRNQIIRVMLAIGLLTVFGGNILEHLYESQITVWYVAVTALMIELLNLNDMENLG